MWRYLKKKNQTLLNSKLLRWRTKMKNLRGNRQDFLSILNEKRVVISPRNIRRTKATTRLALRILVRPRRRNTANIFTLIIVIAQSSNISGVRRRDAIYIHFYHYYYRSLCRVECVFCVLKTRFEADALYSGKGSSKSSVSFWKRESDWWRQSYDVFF